MDTDASVSVYLAHRGVFLCFVKEIMAVENEWESGVVRALLDTSFYGRMLQRFGMQVGIKNCLQNN